MTVRGIVHQRAEPVYVLAGHFPAATISQVTERQHDPGDARLVEKVGTYQLDESPFVPCPHAKLDRRPGLLALHAEQRERRHLAVVHVYESKCARPQQGVDSHAEKALGGVVGPANPAFPVDHNDSIGQEPCKVCDARELSHLRLIDWEISPPIRLRMTCRIR